MKFRYIGSKSEVTAFGHPFPKGEEVEVTNENAVKRLTTNSHFEAVNNDAERTDEASIQKTGGRKPGRPKRK